VHGSLRSLYRSAKLNLHVILVAVLLLVAHASSSIARAHSDTACGIGNTERRSHLQRVCNVKDVRLIIVYIIIISSRTDISGAATAAVTVDAVSRYRCCCCCCCCCYASSMYTVQCSVVALPVIAHTVQHM
jgi:hypothetical protein